MKTIAFWNRKGGTGKTTTAGNVAAQLAGAGSVLSVDCDPQGNLTSWIGPAELDHELADVLTGTVALRDAVHPVAGGWHMVPTAAIGGTLREYAESRLSREPFAFAGLIDQARADGYDYVILDLAPGDSILEVSALAVADEVVLVATPEFFSADGLEGATDTLDGVKRNRRATFTSDRLVVNRINGAYTAHQLYHATLQGAQWKLYSIRQSTAVHDAQLQHQTVFEYAPGDKNTTEYLRLAAEIR